MKITPKKKQLSLIEIAVVLAIIAILASLLFPSLRRAREAARLAQCMNNQKQIGVAMALFAGDNENKLPYARGPHSGGWFYGWEDQLRIYLGGDSIEYSTQINDLWNEEQALDILRCPSAKEKTCAGRSDRQRNSYAMNAHDATGQSLYDGTGSAAYEGYDRFGVYTVEFPQVLLDLGTEESRKERKIRSLEDLGGTFAISEIDYTGNNWYFAQGGGTMIQQAIYQAGANGVGFWTDAGVENTTLDLHTNGKVTYLLADGGVEAHHPFSSEVIGTGTVELPKDMWSKTAGD